MNSATATTNNHTNDHGNPNTLQNAIQQLAARCDGAQEEDGKGFNKPDARYGRLLALQSEADWHPSHKAAAYEVLRKYKNQLADYGVDYDAIEKPEAWDADIAPLPEPPKPRAVINAENNLFIVAFNYSAEKVAGVKAIPGVTGRDYDGANKRWKVRNLPGVADSLRAFAEKHGFDFSDGATELLNTEPLHIVAAPVTVPVVPTFTIVQVGDDWRVSFQYDQKLVDGIKNVKTRRKFDGSTKSWLCEGSAELLAFLDEHSFEGREPLREMLKLKEAIKTENIIASRAEDADIEITGIGGTPMPFQKAGVAYALRNKRIFIADEPGLGKTVQALITIHQARAFPALVICPASIKLNWKRETEKWLPGRRVVVLGTGCVDLSGADVTIVNYDILHVRRSKEAAEALKATGKVPVEVRADLMAVPFKAIIMDEAHAIKEIKRIRSQAVKQLVANAEFRLALTGTPVLNRPKELIAQLDMLDRLKEFGGFWRFAKRYCHATRSEFGMDMKGHDNLAELNEKMRATCFIRREKAQVLPELPAKRRVNVAIEIDNRNDYEHAERNLISWLQEKAVQDQVFLASIAHLEPKQQAWAKHQRAQEAGRKAQYAEQLVRIEALKQVSAKGKLASVIEWVQSFIDTGEKIVVFASHIEIQKKLVTAFPGSASILGEHSVEVRQANVDRFQTDPDCKVVICSLAAASEGITLTAASNVAFVELGWNPGKMDQATDRVHRIGQTDSVTAWYLLAEETIDQDIYALIEAKRKVVDEATNGEVREESVEDAGIINALIEQLLAKGKKVA